MEDNKKELELKKKIVKMRNKISEGLSKGGKNDYSKFKYFQLDDFIPETLKFCEEFNIYTKFEIKKEKRDLPNTSSLEINGDSKLETTTNNFEFVEVAYLTVQDLDTGVLEVYSKETKEASVQGASAIQNLGAKSTYMKRYLYMDMLEIVENDQVDSGAANTNNVEATTVDKVPVVSATKTNAKATKEVAPTPVVDTTQGVETSNEALMSLEDKQFIAKYINEKGLNPAIIMEIAVELGYESAMQFKASDKDKLVEKINERVGK